MQEIVVKKEKHLVLHNNEEIAHYVHVKKGNVIQTAMNKIEEFDTLEEAKTRVNEITNNENYFTENYGDNL
jgi:phage regulator Rha-like protein